MDTSTAEASAKLFTDIFGKDRRPEDVKFNHVPKVTMFAEHLPKSLKLHISQSTRAKPVVFRPTQVDPSVYYQAFASATASAVALLLSCVVAVCTGFTHLYVYIYIYIYIYI